MDNGITWIGFGEAAYFIARDLKNEGFTKMRAYDPAWNDSQRGTLIQKRAAEAGVTLFANSAESLYDSSFIISLTSAKVAFNVAQEVLPLLRSGQTFLDFNSASPVTMKNIAMLQKADGVSLCDVAVMGPVPLNGKNVPLIISGDKAFSFIDEMTKLGMKIEVLDAPVGGASAIKMIRSIFMKGLPQVLLECLIAAESYGITEKMIDSLDSTIQGKTIRQIANQLFTPTALHASRRASEMEEVVAMLKQEALDANMSEGTLRRLRRMAQWDIVGVNEVDKSLDYKEILHRIINNIQ